MFVIKKFTIECGIQKRGRFARWRITLNIYGHYVSILYIMEVDANISKYRVCFNVESLVAKVPVSGVRNQLLVTWPRKIPEAVGQIEYPSYETLNDIWEPRNVQSKIHFLGAFGSASCCGLYPFLNVRPSLKEYAFDDPNLISDTKYLNHRLELICI